MRVFHGFEEFGRTLDQCVLTIGNFDGVHRAHQELVAQSARLTATSGGPTVVLTFEPHPLCVVAPEKAPPRLTPPTEKLRLLEQAGADAVVVVRSEPALLNLEARRFVRTIVYERLHPTHIVEGPGFGFGKGRGGSTRTLAEMAAEFEFEIHIIEPVQLEINGTRRMVSSSLVRELLLDGLVCEAAACLGRRYALNGTVVHGAGRGRQLGFPTANLSVPDQLIPADGVYAGSVRIADRIHDAAVSIGATPTFGGRQRLVELHLLDFDGDLYDQTLRVELNRTLRRQRKFDSPDRLIEQLHRDIQQVRKLAENGLCAG